MAGLLMFAPMRNFFVNVAQGWTLACARLYCECVELSPIGVSRSEARWPARGDLPARLVRALIGVSRSEARWPAREPHSQALILPLFAAL
jgi:hypothetical protein